MINHTPLKYILAGNLSNEQGNSSLIVNSTDGIVNILLNSSLRVITDDDRTIFTGLYSCILLVSVILNIWTIWTIFGRNYRFLHKTCIVALAISDLVTVLAFSINGLETFSHPYINWTLGSFMCHFIPATQSFGVLSSSLALVVIAMDRYRSIVKAMNKRWDPRKSYCILGTLTGWLVCAGLSVPMFLFYHHEKVLVIFLDANGTLPNNFTQEVLYMCAAVDKTPLRNSYIILVLFVFVPLFFIFFFFYYNIAKLIWQHRKPVEAIEETTEISVTDTTTTRTAPSRTTILSANTKEQMKKKICTFKVIIVLTAAFIACRLPLWIFTLLKLTYVLSGLVVWRLNFCIIALNNLNTILDPLLYTYLNTTVKVAGTLTQQVKEFLCCFFSDEEFVEFEKGNLEFINAFDRNTPKK